MSESPHSRLPQGFDRAQYALVSNEELVTVEERQRFLVSDLCEQLEHYLDPDQVKEIYRAYLYSAEAHDGQFRRSGEPYIFHPIEVASILASMFMDRESILAAILHDVIEDTETTKEQLTADFGEGVAELVDGLSKLTQIQFGSKAEAQAENFRKMLLAMVRDVRVILIKLADRLHNMRTLGAMPPDKRRRIARETLEIYAPIANRLGINTIRVELEDLGFASLYPVRHRILRESVKKARGNRTEILHRIENSIVQRLEQEHVPALVKSREKHIYGIYNKMRNKGLSFAEILDVYAFRIAVESVDTCYRVLGIMHNLYKPVPGRFKDYIAIPKANGYQSLHTVLFGPFGVPIEVQIRTHDMHSIAESGIASHWSYKQGDTSPGANSGAHARAHQWLQGLLELQKRTGNSLEFLENVKVDLFPDEVYVFTPKGEIMELPRGATAVDFAFAVHSDLGNRCVAAKIDRRLMPLRTPLLNGQTVEVLVAANALPNPAWLDFVVTGKARANIRSYLKNLKDQEAIKLGQRMLEQALANYSLSLATLPEGSMEKLLQDFKLSGREQLFSEVGLGKRMCRLVAKRLAAAEDDDVCSSNSPLAIKGTEGMVVNFARCCHPIPGDAIMGFLSTGRGIVIHVDGCKNIEEYRNQQERWIDVRWEDPVEGEYSSELRVDVKNQRGVLATIASVIAETGSNIENVTMTERDGLTSSLTFCISVNNRAHLARIMRHIRSLAMVMRVARVRT